MKKSQTILSRSDKIDDKYTVHFFIRQSSHAESYRVKNDNGETFFLKLFNYSKLHRTQFDPDGNIKEIEFLKKIRHPNIVRYRDSGEWFYKNHRYAYLVLDFISGETLSEKMKRNHSLDSWEVREIAVGVLNCLKYLHTRERPIVHNDINHQNIMLDMGSDVQVAKITDFGHARHFHNSTKVYYREGLNPYYLAPECFNNVFSPQSDIFSAGALMYNLLFGIPPWFTDLSEYHKNKGEWEEKILESRQKPLKVPTLGRTASAKPESEDMLPIIKKALEADVDQRFKSAEEMLAAFNGDIKVETSKANSIKSDGQNKTSIKSTTAGRGFDDIAGMDELKETLYLDVIRALAEKELYEKYGLSIPNGMLLYGPPGCGKSFFAEKLAEEADYNYVEVKPSTLASIYVHGAQEKIGQLFDDARKNAPTIINFDEFDALVPRRDGKAGPHQSGEVNEFLTQLNNCGKDGVFVIGSTNQPQLIDPAVMRPGRIDKVFLVPPPDCKARKALFRIMLEKRPVDFGLNYDLLADKTDGYVPVDIEHLVNEASKKALQARSKITEEILIETVNNSRPSLKEQEIQSYENIKGQIEGSPEPEGEKRPIGFGTGR